MKPEIRGRRVRAYNVRPGDVVPFWNSRRRAEELMLVDSCAEDPRLKIVTLRLTPQVAPGEPPPRVYRWTVKRHHAVRVLREGEVAA